MLNDVLRCFQLSFSYDFTKISQSKPGFSMVRDQRFLRIVVLKSHFFLLSWDEFPQDFLRMMMNKVKSRTHHIPVRDSQSLAKQSSHRIDVHTWQSGDRHSGVDKPSMTSVYNVP